MRAIHLLCLLLVSHALCADSREEEFKALKHDLNAFLNSGGMPDSDGAAMRQVGFELVNAHTSYIACRALDAAMSRMETPGDAQRARLVLSFMTTEYTRLFSDSDTKMFSDIAMLMTSPYSVRICERATALLRDTGKELAELAPAGK